MLARVTGSLTGLDAVNRLVWLTLGGLTLEIQAPASTIQALEATTGELATLYTHLEFAPQGPVGALRPRLYGFAHPLDKQFFLKLITVKGVGASVALDMMAAPTAAIAAAIEGRDEAFLKTLPRIGGSKAKLLIAELSEKVAAFQGASGPKATQRARATEAPASDLDPLGQTVQAILVRQLDMESREAAQLIQRAQAAHPEIEAVEELLGVVFTLRLPA